MPVYENVYAVRIKKTKVKHIKNIPRFHEYKKANIVPIRNEKVIGNGEQTFPKRNPIVPRNKPKRIDANNNISIEASPDICHLVFKEV